MEWIPINETNELPKVDVMGFSEIVYLKVNGAKRIGYYNSEVNKWRYFDKKTDLTKDCTPTHWAKK